MATWFGLHITVLQVEYWQEVWTLNNADYIVKRKINYYSKEIRFIIPWNEKPKEKKIFVTIIRRILLKKYFNKKIQNLLLQFEYIKVQITGLVM